MIGSGLKIEPLSSHSDGGRGEKENAAARGANRAGRYFTAPPRSESSDKWWRHLSSPCFFNIASLKYRPYAADLKQQTPQPNTVINKMITQ